MQFSIEQVTETSKTELIHFLRQHEDYALFLLSNLEAHGLRLTEAANSGNFKIIRLDDKVRGAFCLARRGSLLIISEIEDPVLFNRIYQVCQEESLTLKGVIGPWNFCHPFWDFLKSYWPTVRQANGLIYKSLGHRPRYDRK